MSAFSILFAQDAPDINSISYRPPTVAGAFYPDKKDELNKMLDEFLKPDEPLTNESDIYAIVAPHAGYVYSGWIAGKAYRELSGKKYDAVIVISPSHTKAFNGASVFRGDGYNTPLGTVYIDKELSKSISDYKPDLIKLSLDGHDWKGSRSEHALEVQLPFLQKVLPSCPIVAIVMGSQDYTTTDFLTKAIVNAIKQSGKKVLIVASSDLSHYHDSKTCKALDSNVISAFNSFDYFRMELNLFSRSWEACGGGPIVVAMMAAEQFGADKAMTVMAAHSGESPYVSTGNDQVVGYFSGLITKSNDDQQSLLPALTNEEKNELLSIARATVASAVSGTSYQLPATLSPNLLSEYSSFVTLWKNGNLRGCMGYTIAQGPLAVSVAETGKMAATRDPRFPQVSPKELDSLKIDVTVLSRMKRVLNFDEIEVGRDGILLRQGNHSGVFLPQVAVEQGWDRTELLRNIGRKAGLSYDAYKSPDAEIYIFRGLKIE